MTHRLELLRRPYGKDYEYIARLQVRGVLWGMRWVYFGRSLQTFNDPEHLNGWIVPPTPPTVKEFMDFPPGWFASEDAVWTKAVEFAKSYVKPRPVIGDWITVRTTDIVPDAPDRLED